MNIKINTEGAREKAARIDSIVNSIAEDMKILNDVFNKNIILDNDSNSGEGINTAWSRELLLNWNSYYTKDIPVAMEDMKLSASNLRAAIEKSEEYSKRSNSDIFNA